MRTFAALLRHIDRCVSAVGVRAEARRVVLKVVD